MIYTQRIETPYRYLEDLRGDDLCSVRFCKNKPHNDSTRGLCAVHEVDAAMNVDEDSPMTPNEIEEVRFWVGELTDSERTAFLDSYLPN